MRKVVNNPPIRISVVVFIVVLSFSLFFADRELSHARHDEVQGEGLGLAIVRKILDMHGGGIWSESKLGVGSKFYVSLPTEPKTNGGE